MNATMVASGTNLSLLIWLTDLILGKARGRFRRKLNSEFRGVESTETTEEDHITAGVAARQHQLLSVCRPVKIEDTTRCEFGELFGLAASYRLFPNICCAASGEEELQPLSIMRPAQSMDITRNFKDPQSCAPTGWDNGQSAAYRGESVVIRIG